MSEILPFFVVCKAKQVPLTRSEPCPRMREGVGLRFGNISIGYQKLPGDFWLGWNCWSGGPRGLLPYIAVRPVGWRVQWVSASSRTNQSGSRDRPLNGLLCTAGRSSAGIGTVNRPFRFHSSLGCAMCCSSDASRLVLSALVYWHRFKRSLV